MLRDIRFRSLATCLGIAMLWACDAQAQAPAAGHAAETEKSAAGVIAADDHWSVAEYMGDTAYLDRLLSPHYRSVNPDGTSLSKDRIVSGAAKRSGTTLDDAKKKAAAYRAGHPYRTSVVLEGDIAILSFYDIHAAEQQGLTSSDVFVYANGRWQALYSQHTSVGNH